VRDPTVNAADEVKAAIDIAVRYLGLFQRLGVLSKAYVDPDQHLRSEARMQITAMGVLTNDMLPEHLRMPKHVRDYLYRLLEEQPTGKATVARRDACITSAIWQIVGRGFAATRNAGTRDKESACSIVQKALARVGLTLSERTVEDIWDSLHDRVGPPDIWEI
jgi:hypothetical protein